MRILPIIKPDGEMDECTLGIVQAAMIFPDDSDSMNEEIEAFRMRAKTGFRKTGLGNHLAETWRAAQLGGLCAGSMLYTMIMFDRYHPELFIGMNKSAVATAIELRKDFKKKNESTIKKYWAQYKNAVHLWAAFLLEWEENGKSFSPPLNMLGILNKAERLVAKGSTLEVFEAGRRPWEPWRTPSELIDADELEIRCPDAEDISLVKRYRADGLYPA